MDNKTVDSKKLLKGLADAKTKIKFNDRIELEVLNDTQFYKKGQIINPHRTFGNQLVKQKIAKEVK